jgi:hypothetical protein
MRVNEVLFRMLHEVSDRASQLERHIWEFLYAVRQPIFPAEK